MNSNPMQNINNENENENRLASKNDDAPNTPDVVPVRDITSSSDINITWINIYFNYDSPDCTPSNTDVERLTSYLDDNDDPYSSSQDEDPLSG